MEGIEAGLGGFVGPQRTLVAEPKSVLVPFVAAHKSGYSSAFRIASVLVPCKFRTGDLVVVGSFVAAVLGAETVVFLDRPAFEPYEDESDKRTMLDYALKGSFGTNRHRLGFGSDNLALSYPYSDAFDTAFELLARLSLPFYNSEFFRPFLF